MTERYLIVIRHATTHSNLWDGPFEGTELEAHGYAQAVLEVLEPTDQESYLIQVLPDHAVIP